MSQNKTKVLGVFSLTMINVAAIQSLRNLAVMAEAGWASLFFYLSAGLLFFIPASLVAAELACKWPSAGGVYTWVREAFGPRWGFVAIFLQWSENIIWYPTILSFAAATIAYLIDPSLAKEPVFIISMIISIFWLSTLFDAFGMRISSIVSSFGVIAGTLIPAGLILILGALWVFQDMPTHIPFSTDALFPDMSQWGNIVVLTGVVLSFGGIEMPAVHAKDVVHPRRSYPLAIFLSMGLILTISIFGSLAIATVVPKQDLSLVSGVMQAFSTFFEAFHLSFLTKIFAGMIFLGAFAMVATWIVGPSKGLCYAAEQGDFPKIFTMKNRWGMPVLIMGFQGVLVMLLSFVFILTPNVSSSFWILTDLTATLYILMYLIMFLAAIRLKIKHGSNHAVYEIPGGKVGGVLVAAIGFATCLFTLAIGFVPPTHFQPDEIKTFYAVLGGCALFFFLVPHLIYSWNHKALK